MMPEILPLSENDQARLKRRAEESKKTSLFCLGGALFLPLFVGLLLRITPMDFELKTIYLACILVSLFASPFVLLFLDARRKNKQAKYWLEQNCKHQIRGVISEKDHATITVESKKIPLWESKNRLSIGQEITVEYLPSESDAENVRDVLQINGEQNPNFENIITIGAPST